MLKSLCTALVLTGIGSMALAEDGHASLIGPWKVTEVSDTVLPAEAPTELEFLKDGALAGNAGCNRLIGNYEVGAGGAITLNPQGVTMMACPEGAMAQETRLLELLPQITNYAFDKGGALMLTTQDGQIIRAERS